MPVDSRGLAEQAAKIEALAQEIESFEDQGARDTAMELLQALLQLYGEGLGRILEIVAQRDAGGLDALGQDELVAHLLLLHGLHPVPVETRVALALDEVRPYLRSHGGDVELLHVEAGVARLRLHGSCHGCPSSAVTFKLAIEEAIQKVAPDLEGIEVEGVTEPLLGLYVGS